MLGFSILLGKNIYGRVGALNMAKEIKSKYTDVPVKDISNGVIVLDNNQKVTGVKIMPRNIFILDQSMQDDKVQLFEDDEGREYLWLVEGYTDNILGAKENGLQAIGVLYGYGSREELEQAGAMAVAETIRDIPSLLL